MPVIRSASSIKTLDQPGRYSAGDGLYLVISSTGHRTWIMRYQLDGKRTDMGLGPYPAISLATARGAAIDAQRQVAQKVSPIAARKAANRASRPVPTFSDIAERVIEDVGNQSTNEKVRYRAKLLLGKKYCGRILSKPVNAISAADVARLLNGVKATKPETARKLHGLLAKVFEAARVLLRDQHGVALGDQPTNLKDLKALGYDLRVRNQPHPALDPAQVPEFMAALRQQESIAFRALELLVLTGLRAGEVAGAQWPEIDLDNALWTIPVERLKDRLHRNQPHRVPLSSRALKIIRKLQGVDDDWVFPGSGTEKSIVPASILQALKKLNVDKHGKPIWVDPVSKKRIVVHGFRSTLRTWAEERGFRREAAEESLGHKIGNQIEGRYRRTDILDERRKLLDAWATYCGSAKADAKVIPIRAKK
jgi:integrase